MVKFQFVAILRKAHLASTEQQNRFTCGTCVTRPRDRRSDGLAPLLSPARLFLGCSEHASDFFVERPNLVRIALRPLVVGVGCPEKRFCSGNLRRPKALERFLRVSLGFGVL